MSNDEEILKYARKFHLWYKRWEQVDGMIPKSSDAPISKQRLEKLQEKRRQASDRCVQAKILMFKAIESQG